MRVAYRARLTKSLNSVQMDAIHPRSQIRLPKLDGTEPGTPSHRYHPRPTDLTRMIVNWVCRKPSAGSEIRLAYRESMIALSIIKSRSCGSKLNSVRLIILRPGVLVVPVVLVGLEAKPAGRMDKSGCQSLSLLSTGTPSHRYHPRPLIPLE